MEEKKGFEYRSFFWPILLIGVGVIWLLGNLDILPHSSLRMLLRMWPLIFVVIGLDILFGRRSPLIGGLIGLGAVAVVIIMLLLAPSLSIETNGELKTLNFSESLGGAASARINLDLERYPTTIEALSDSNLLIEAELDTLTNVVFSASGDQEKSVSLNPVEDYSFDYEWYDIVDAQWEIGLSPDVPLDLTVDIGSGSTTLDLMDLELSDLMIDGGSGSVELTLPASTSQYSVEIDSGSGSFDVELEAGADIVAVMEVGSDSFDFEIGSGSDVDVRIDGGSGDLTVDVPNDVGVQVVIRDSGSGRIHIPGSYRLVDDLGDDDRDTGIWESEGFSSASHQIEITFDPGSGNLTLR